MKKNRVTIRDLAHHVGVGTATVDRVLNERGNVSEAVRRKVIAAARELDFPRRIPSLYRPNIRIEVFIARPNLPLLERMATEFRGIAGKLDRAVKVLIRTLSDESPNTIATGLAETKSDAVVLYAQDHPIVREAIEGLSLRNVPVVTMISDLPTSSRLAYAGTKHYQAGRTAGYFLRQIAPYGGKVVVLCNQLSFQSHADRIRGVKDYFTEHAPMLEVFRIIEGRDDRDRSEIRLMEAISAETPVVAVYNVGAANLGVRAALERCDAGNRPAFIGHELTIHTAKMLRDGIMAMTICQNPQLQAQFAIDVLLDYFGYDGIPVKPPYDSTVPIALYTPENIPSTL